MKEEALKLADDLDNSNGLQYMTKVGLASISADMIRKLVAELDKQENARCIACGWNQKLLEERQKQ